MAFATAFENMPDLNACWRPSGMAARLFGHNRRALEALRTPDVKSRAVLVDAGSVHTKHMLLLYDVTSENRVFTETHAGGAAPGMGSSVASFWVDGSDDLNVRLLKTIVCSTASGADCNTFLDANQDASFAQDPYAGSPSLTFVGRQGEFDPLRLHAAQMVDTICEAHSLPGLAKGSVGIVVTVPPTYGSATICALRGDLLNELKDSAPELVPHILIYPEALAMAVGMVVQGLPDGVTAVADIGGYTTTCVSTLDGAPLATDERFDLGEPQKYKSECVCLGGHRFDAYFTRFACLTDDELTSELMTLYTFADDRALQSAVQSASNFFKLARHCKRVVAVGYGGALVRPGAETQPFISALCTGLLRSTDEDAAILEYMDNKKRTVYVRFAEQRTQLRFTYTGGSGKQPRDAVLPTAAVLVAMVAAIRSGFAEQRIDPVPVIEMFATRTVAITGGANTIFMLVALPAVLESAYLNRKTHSVASTTMAKHLTACLQHTAGETSVEVRLQGGGHLASKTSIVLIEARDKHVVCKHVLEGAKIMLQRLLEADEAHMVGMCMRLGYALDQPGAAVSAPMVMFACDEQHEAEYDYVHCDGLVTVALDAPSRAGAYVNKRGRVTVLRKAPYHDHDSEDAGPISHVMCTYQAGTGVCEEGSEDEQAFLGLLGHAIAPVMSADVAAAPIPSKLHVTIINNSTNRRVTVHITDALKALKPDAPVSLLTLLLRFSVAATTDVATTKNVNKHLRAGLRHLLASEHFRDHSSPILDIELDNGTVMPVRASRHWVRKVQGNQFYWQQTAD